MNTKKNTIHVCLTSKCNYCCSYCFFPVHLSDESDFNVQTWRKIINRIINVSKVCNIKRISFVGGEPLLSPALFELIDLCNERKMECSLTTNGSLLSERIISILEGKIAYLGLSVDSINRDTNIRIGRHVNERCLSRNQIIRISQALSEHNIPLKINRVISKLNCDEKPSILFDNLIFSRLKLINLYMNYGINDFSKSLQLSQIDFQKVCAAYTKYAPEIETEETMTNAYYIINSNGDVVISRNGFLENHGNILSMSLKELILKWS